MFTEIKNTTTKNIFIDVEGAEIPVRKTDAATKIVKSFRSIADMESGKFRRLFNRHKVVYRY